MTNIYLAQWQWLADGIDSRWEAPIAGNVGGIDLRSIPQMSLAGGAFQGWGLFTYPGPVAISGALSLGNNLSVNLSTPIKNAIRNRLGIASAFAGSTLLDVLWEILTSKADSTGLLRCKPLMPTTQGNLELHLGGFSLVRSEQFQAFTHPHWPQVLAVLQNDYRRVREEYQAIGLPDVPRKVLGSWKEKYHVADHRVFLPPDLPDEGWLPPSTVITDNFNRANESLDVGPWVEVVNNWFIAANVASTDGGSNGLARHTTALASDNHYSEIVKTLNDLGCGAAARISLDASPNQDCYFVRLKGTTIAFKKVINGTITDLDTDRAYTETLPDTIRIEVDGSSMKSYFNTVLEHNFTDASLTGNLSAGMDCRGGDDLDNFEAADLAVDVYSGRGVGRGVGRGIMR